MRWYRRLRGWLISLPPHGLVTISHDLALISHVSQWEIAGDRAHIEGHELMSQPTIPPHSPAPGDICTARNLSETMA